jgi:hypothetical protein
VPDEVLLFLMVKVTLGFAVGDSQGSKKGSEIVIRAIF